MVVLKFSKNGLCALICENILRIYTLKEPKLIFKHTFCEVGKLVPESKSNNDSTQFSNTTFSHSCVFSNSGKFLAVFSQKELMVWKTSDTEKNWELVGERKMLKRATAILITNAEDQVIISDKSGDVYSYSISDGLSDETLRLGTVSMILDMAISSDDWYLLSSDRDEKIRVSCYPNSYNIEAFCLGHTEYVMKIMLLKRSPEILVSVSGDGTVRFWQFKTGKTIHVESLGNNSSNQSSSEICCLACSRQDNIVFVAIKGSNAVHVYKISDDNQVQSVSTNITLSATPCSLSVDYDNRLWVVQSNKEHTTVIFDIKYEDGFNYKFSKVSDCPSISNLLSIEGWDLIYDGLRQMPCFEELSKSKEGCGTGHYFQRKKARIEANKRKQDGLVNEKTDTEKEISLSDFKKLKA